MSINQYTMNSLLDNQKIGKRKFYGPYKPAGTAGNSGTQAVNSAGTCRRGSPEPRFPSGKARPNISRRDSLRKKSHEPAFRPSGIITLFEQNSKLIDRIKQKPDRTGKANGRKQKRKREPFSLFSLFRIGSLIRFFTPDGQTDTEPGVDRPDGQPDKNRQYEYRRPEELRPGRRRRETRFPSFAFPVVPAVAFFLLALGVFFLIQSQGGALDWVGREVANSVKDQGSDYNLALYAGVNHVESPENPGEKSEEVIPLDLTETFAWLSYKVQKGDSVSKIAVAFSVSMDAIIASNGITNARSLREGEVLRIPNMDGIPYTVKKGDSLSGISVSMGVPMDAILDANDIQSDIINIGMTLFIPGARMKREDLRLALGELFIYPLKGSRLSSPFGWRDDPISGERRHHAALDLAAPQGTPVYAAMEGKVSALGFNMVYGNFVILEHPGGFQTMYAHLHTVSVKKGDQLKQGARIGAVGTTGYSTGPHLHFAVFKNNRAVNPLDFLNPRG